METGTDNPKRSFPFSVISGTRILVVLVLSIVFVAVLEVTAAPASLLNQIETIHIASSLIFLILLASILIQFRDYPHLWASLAEPPQHIQYWKIAFIVLPLIMLSIGTGWLWDFVQLQLFPSYLESRWQWMAENPLIDNNGSFRSMVITFISVAIIAPVVEELLFRGIIFDKLSGKWDATTGTLLSSMFFGFLHLDPIGAFLFGVVMCLIYLHTNSLLIPIICHALNNFTVVLLAQGIPFEVALFETKRQLYSQSWIGIALLIIGLLWLCWFMNNKEYALLNVSASGE